MSRNAFLKLFDAEKWKRMKTESDDARLSAQDRYRQEHERHEETQAERNKYKVSALISIEKEAENCGATSHVDGFPMFDP